MRIIDENFHAVLEPDWPGRLEAESTLPAGTVVV
jgi:hypothetical protein